MSYCRWMSGDIYLYGDISYNGIVCMCCCLEDKSHIDGEIRGYNVIFRTYSSAIKHMEDHRHAGDRAPYKRAIEYLKEDQAKDGDIIDYSDIRAEMAAESVQYNYINQPLKGQFRWN